MQSNSSSWPWTTRIWSLCGRRWGQFKKWLMWAQGLFQPEDGHAFVGIGKVRVGTQFGNHFKKLQHDGIENGKSLAGDKILDDALLLAERERFSQAMMQRAAPARGTVSVDDFQDTHALAFGFPDFIQNHPASLVEGREITLDVEGFKAHGFVRAWEKGKQKVGIRKAESAGVGRAEVTTVAPDERCGMFLQRRSFRLQRASRPAANSRSAVATVKAQVRCLRLVACASGQPQHALTRRPPA